MNASGITKMSANVQSYDLISEQTKSSMGDTTAYSLDLWKFYQQFIDQATSETARAQLLTMLKNGAVFFGGNESDFGSLGAGSSPFEQALAKQIYNIKFGQLAKKYMRSYEQIMKGEPAYSETILYRIEKRAPITSVAANGQTTTAAGPVVQNIWMPNTSKSNVLEYVDTQVKYGRNYTYRIYAYQVVIGTNYQYRFDNDSDNGTWQGNSNIPPVKKWPNLHPPPATDIFGETYTYLGDGSYETFDRSEHMVFATETFPTWQTNPNNPNDTHSITGGGVDIFGSNNGFYIFPSGQLQAANPSVPKSIGTTIQTIMTPSIKLIEVPYHFADADIRDNPPLPPQVQISPFKKVDDRILISFNNSSGVMMADPLPISPEDENVLQSIKNKQNKLLFSLFPEVDKDQYLKKYGTSAKVTFSNDDYATEFEIYRTSIAPKSYKDFEDNKRTTIDTKFSTSFVDAIVPNQKFWYCFRAIDYHNQASNPSPVYQVEMVSEDNSHYFTIRAYQMDNEAMIAEDYQKTMRRYMQIQAAPGQAILDPDASGLVDKPSAKNVAKPVLGLLSERMFNSKKFKVRVSSLSSGRKFDINLKFTTDFDPMTKYKPTTEE